MKDNIKPIFHLYDSEIRPEVELNKHQKISNPKKKQFFFIDCCESVYTGKNPIHCTAKNLNISSHATFSGEVSSKPD